jgi:hypothetical protein
VTRRPFSHAVGRLTLAFGLALSAALALVGCVDSGSTSQSRAAVVSPHGSGSACSAAEPCSFAHALAAAESGGRNAISLRSGQYGNLTLSTGTRAVAIAAASGTHAKIGKLDLERPGTTWRRVTVTGGVYLGKTADSTTLDRVHVDGSGVFVHAAHVVIRSSTIENGTSIDGIQLGGAQDVTIEDSTVRDFGQGADSQVHTDCVQLFDSQDIVLRGNYLGRCDNSSLIFSPGGGTGNRNVTVEANQIQGCPVKSQRCSQGTALDLRANAIDVTVRNNTMLDGSVMVDASPGLVFDRNIVGYASNCAMPMTNSIVIAWNTGICHQPAMLGTDGNRSGEVRVKDQAHGDLSVVDASQATVQASGGSAATTGYDGARLSADEAGAGG